MRSSSSYNSQKSLTDDLPVCKNTGIGYSINQIYREDGNPQEEHMYEDCNCHLKYSDNLYLYAVFDGTYGKRAANFCLQQMSAELLFWEAFNCQPTDEEVKELIRQIFTTTEENYMQSLNDMLAEKANHLCDLPPNMNLYNMYQNNPRITELIEQIDYELSSEASAAVVIIYKNKLYVANAGNCRVLLCQTDSNSVLTVKQLSTDHNLRNEDEILRLSHLGVNVYKLRQNATTSLRNTRCLGNYLLKEEYRNCEEFSTAVRCPIIAEPDIIGGITLDESCRFLLIMSEGLHKSIEEVIEFENVNRYIADRTVEQFREQTSLSGVAQGVVDNVVRLHRDWFMSNLGNKTNNSPCKREDITLAIRNFNYPMPNAIKSPTSISLPSFSTPNAAGNSSESTCTTENAQGTITSTIRTQYTESVRSQSKTNTVDKRIDAYVDFTEFNENYEKAKQSGKIPRFI